MNDLPPHTHNALDDAIEQGIIFTRMLKTLRDESPGSMTRLHPHTFS